MKKILLITFYLMLNISCGARKEIVDIPLEGTYIIHNNIKYQVFKIRKVTYIIKYDVTMKKTIRQKVILSL